MKAIFLLLLLFAVPLLAQDSPPSKQVTFLNVGTFHMGQTSDANTVDFDEATEENARQIASVCEQLARFKPTIICLEISPKHQKELAEAYAAYRKNPEQDTEYSDSEIQLLGFEIGRLAGAEKVYAIDHKLSYNYDLAGLAEETDSQSYFREVAALQQAAGPLLQEGLALSKSLQLMNTPAAYDLLINFNADLLTHANSPDGFEGADEAAKYYQRNFRMFANINKLPLRPEDRVLIISGASHAAFFQMLLRRSHQYRTVALGDYLK